MRLTSKTLELTTCLALAFAAGTAWAQTEAMPESAPVVLSPVGYPAQPYSDRAIGTVYSNAGPAGSSLNGIAGNTHVHWADDFDFAGGPWATTSTRLLTTVGVWVQKGCTTPTTFDILLSVYDQAAFDFSANPMPTAAPLFTGRYAVVNSGCGVQTRFDLSLAALPGGGLLLPSSRGVVEIALVNAGTNVLRPFAGNGGTQIEIPVYCRGSTTVTDGSVAQSSTSLAADFNDGIFAGGAVVDGIANGAVEHRRYETAVGSGLFRNHRMWLRGDIPPAPPANPIVLGCIADSGVSRDDALAANSVLWYSLCLNGAATDVARQFIDIDSETSAVADTSMALYQSDGTLIALDADDGSDANSQLTFGICRRNAVGNGMQYDGRDGQLTAGTYYLAVGAAGTTFAAGFNAISTSSTTGNVHLNIQTNTNGASLAPSVAPATVVDGAFGSLMPPGAQSIAAAVPQGIAWYSFTSGAATNPGSYLDLDASTSAAAADVQMAIYNSLGTLIASDNDDGPGFLPQMSFGDVGPRPGMGDGEPFDGRDGNLPAGTYYVVLQLAPFAAPGADRWCARSTSTSNFPMGLSVITNVASTPSCHGDCVADFDDGSGTGVPDMGVTIDDLLYYLGIFEAGILCADVDDGSGTGTQDMGVTIDDLLYYLFRFEAGC